VKVETLAEQLFYTTLYVRAQDTDAEWSGTGFIYAVDTDKGQAHFLVTNKHVLAGARRLVVRIICGAENPPVLGDSAEISMENFDEAAWYGHPDPRVDVAVMPLLRFLEAVTGLGKTPFFRSVSPSICISPDTADDFDAIEPIVFIGYPVGLYDSVNYLPVTRQGMTATPISVDYCGKPAFLVDASVFPGSSGSPVFIMDRGSYLTRTAIQIGSRVVCLGVLAAVHTRQVAGEIRSLPTRLVAAFDEPIDLGIVYKAWVIDECVEPVLLQHGLTRVAESVGEDQTSPADRELAD
jgi:hypothetical protein